MSTTGPSQDKKKRNPSLETKLRHATENVRKATAAVQDFEEKLNITHCWTSGDPGWKTAAMLVNRRRYQWCLDELERLVVSRMFELTKMNMSQTGSYTETILYGC